MGLNAKRQARDEAAMDGGLQSDAAQNAPLLSEVDDDKQHHQIGNINTDRQESDEVRPPCPRVPMHLEPRQKFCLLPTHLPALGLG